MISLTCNMWKNNRRQCLVSKWEMPKLPLILRHSIEDQKKNWRARKEIKQLSKKGRKTIWRKQYQEEKGKVGEQNWKSILNSVKVGNGAKGRKMESHSKNCCDLLCQGLLIIEMSKRSCSGDFFSPRICMQTSYVSTGQSNVMAL